MGLAIYPVNSASRKVLVTGADGFIGTELCRQLTEAGYSLLRFSRSRVNDDSTKTAGTEFGTRSFTGDILDRELVLRALKDVQLVFHLAGIAHVDYADKEHLQAVNVEGSANLAAAAREAGVERIIYFSSSLASAAEQNRPDQTAYGRSKYLAEQRLIDIAQGSSLKISILRPVNVYGPGMKGNLAALINLIRRRILPPLPKLSSRLSLVGLEDLCRVALLVAQKDQASESIFTVTDGVTYQLNGIEAAIYKEIGRTKPGWHSPRVVYYLAAALAGLLGRTGMIETSLTTRTYVNLVSDNVFSNRRICEELGFIPRQTFYTALPELIHVK